MYLPGRPAPCYELLYALRIPHLVETQKRGEMISRDTNRAGLDPDDLGHRPVHLISNRLLRETRILACLPELIPQAPSLYERA